jgi:hypothetical protein
MNMKAVCFFWGLLFVSSEALAIQWCKLELKTSADIVVGSPETSDRANNDFYGKKVGRLDDCDTCWSEGKRNGPAACGRQSTATKYVVTCQRNSGQQKVETYFCP